MPPACVGVARRHPSQRSALDIPKLTWGVGAEVGVMGGVGHRDSKHVQFYYRDTRQALVKLSAAAAATIAQRTALRRKKEDKPKPEHSSGGMVLGHRVFKQGAAPAASGDKSADKSQ